MAFFMERYHNCFTLVCHLMFIFVSLGNNSGADEISVFNGDDNHKVWAGKEPPPGVAAAADVTDGLYGDYGSTMRSFRSSASGLSTRHRPRQMMMQSPPPPLLMPSSSFSYTT